MNRQQIPRYLLLQLAANSITFHGPVLAVLPFVGVDVRNTHLSERAPILDSLAFYFDIHEGLRHRTHGIDTTIEVIGVILRYAAAKSNLAIFDWAVLFAVVVEV